MYNVHNCLKQYILRTLKTTVLKDVKRNLTFVLNFPITKSLQLWLEIYRDLKIRVCGKDLIPLYSENALQHSYHLYCRTGRT